MTARTASLGSLVEIFGGGTPSKSRAEYFHGSIPWVTPKDMKTWNIADSEDHISEEAVAASAAKVVPEGSVLVVIRSGVLKHTLPVGIARRPVTVNQDMKALVCGSEIEPRYLAYYLKSAEQRLLMTVRGTTADNIPLDELKSLPVPILAMPDQSRIADILDKADAIRGKRKEAIALTDQLLRSTFLEIFGDPVTNPKRLERGHLRDFLLMPLRNGLSPATGGQHKAQLLTLSAITRGAFDGGATKEGVFAFDPWPDVRLDERDFLVCRGNGNRDLVGAGAFPDRSDPSVVFPDTMIAARVDPRRVGRAFLEQLWKSRLVRAHVEASARTTNGTFKVNQSAVEATPILLPEAGELARFESFALRQRVFRAGQAAAYEGSDALFESLVSCAFQGELASVSP